MTKPGHRNVTTPCRSIVFSNLSADVCQSIGDVLARVGDKWSILVMAVLSRRSMRFSELKRSLGSISQKVLTMTLRGLERDGYITRKVTPSIPPRVDYNLNELGARCAHTCNRVGNVGILSSRGRGSGPNQLRSTVRSS